MSRSLWSWNTGLWVVWALFVVYGTLIPFNLKRELIGLDQIASRWREAFATTDASIPDIVANVLLFVPGGALFVWRARRGNARGALLGVALAGALSVAVETLQLFSPSRTTSLWDVATNTFGAGLGAWLGLRWAALSGPRLEMFVARSVRRLPMTSLAGVATLGALLVGVLPLDVTLDVGMLKRALRAAEFWPNLSDLEIWSAVSDLAWWALWGGLVVLARDREGWKVPLPATALAVIVALGIECAQLFVISRTFDSMTVGLAALGATAGGTIVRSLGASGRLDRVVWAGVGTWGFAVAGQTIAPGDFGAPSSSFLEWITRLPFWHHYLRTDFTSLTDAITQALAYAPFALLASAGFRASRLRIVGASLAFALSLEFIQRYVAGRTADTTDALLAGLGTYFALRVYSRYRDLIPPQLETSTLDSAVEVTTSESAATSS